MKAHERILYRDFKDEELFDNIAWIIDNYKDDYYNMEDIAGLCFECMNKLAELGDRLGFKGNLKNCFVAYILANSENAFSKSAECNGNATGSARLMALHDMEIFKKMVAFDLNEVDEYLGIECFRFVYQYENSNEKNKYFNSQIKSEFNNKIEENEIDYLLNENKKELDNIQENIEKEISSLKFKQHTNEFDYNNIIKKLEEKARIEEELQNSLEEKDELLKLEKEITIAKIAIERAYEKMKNEITPKFTKNLSNIVDKISNGKYNKIKFVDGEGLIVELENGEYVNANKLSIGTIDELYLSLRLSAIEEITREKMPIILDEAFAYFDNQRLENILEFINNNLTENQVIIFTCSNREKDILNKQNIKYNYIEI